jgi:hypothetical protein
MGTPDLLIVEDRLLQGVMKRDHLSRKRASKSPLKDDEISEMTLEKAAWHSRGRGFDSPWLRQVSLKTSAF